MGRRLLIPGAAVKLARAVKAGDIQKFQRGVQLERIAAIVFDGIRRAHHLDMLQPGNGAQKTQLHIHRQGRGQALEIHLLRLQAAGLDKHLMALLIGKTDDFILDAGTITGAHPFDFSPIQGRAVQVLQNHPFGFRAGPGDMAGQAVFQRLEGFKGERHHRVFPVLLFQTREVNARAQHAGGGAGFKPAKTHPQLQQGGRQLGGGEHAVRPALIRDIPHKDFSLEEGAGGQDHRLRGILHLQSGGQQPLAGGQPFQADDFPLPDIQAGFI